MLALLALPLLSLLLRVPVQTLWAGFSLPMVQEAMKLSLLTSLFSTVAVVVLGLPVAYVLATREFPGKRLVEVLVELPIVLPPTVAGLGLLLAFGRAGLAGGALRALGVESSIHDPRRDRGPGVRRHTILYFCRHRGAARGGTAATATSPPRFEPPRCTCFGGCSSHSPFLRWSPARQWVGPAPSASSVPRSPLPVT